MENYQVIIPLSTVERAKNYLQALQNGTRTSGNYLHKALNNKSIQALSYLELLEVLLQTKRPQIFAESAVIGDGTDWNLIELSLLGDIGISIPVEIFDNGQHQKPFVHKVPFEGVLLYTPGALLRNDRGKEAADWAAVTLNGKVDYQRYYQLYQRRLLPLLIHANQYAKSKNRKAFITIPGLGCGMFAGPFQGALGALLKQVFVDLLKNYGQQFSAIKALYYDPYNECSNERLEINGVSLFIRPLLQGNQHKTQLLPPRMFEETGDDFSTCLLFSMVAWDHVSWPGNDFYINSRATDDGVKAAATDSMWRMTGIKGSYDSQSYSYQPPKLYYNWKEVILQEEIKIEAKENVLILP